MLIILINYKFIVIIKINMFEDYVNITNIDEVSSRIIIYYSRS
jgi:hypothetical protein